MLELDVISKDEIVKVSRFLEQIFSHRKLIFWEKSVFSILQENSINGIDNAGYIYCKNSEIYAAILIIYIKKTVKKGSNSALFRQARLQHPQ